MKALTISGSLRARSTNTAVLRAVALVAGPDFEITHYDGLSEIPPFNPDLDIDPGPEPVSRFRAALRSSDCVLFSTPEYAHGIPGSLKNALDWVVGSGELSEKPVALVNASVQGEYARAALRTTLLAMNCRVVQHAEVTIALWDKTFDAARITATPEFAELLTTALREIRGAISRAR